MTLAVDAQRASAQRIEDSEYLHYVPLEYPRLTRQTDASVAFNLFGDQDSPDYVDVSPIDGIDDARGEVLMDLIVRFAPFMVQNTFSIPFDHRKLMGRFPVFNLTVDTWDLATGDKLIGRETLDFNSLGEASCPEDIDPMMPLDPDSPDCRVVALTELFDPDIPIAGTERAQAVDVKQDEIDILYFDMPGYDENTWKKQYLSPVTDRLRDEFYDSIKTYTHPFIEDVFGKDGVHLGYRFVIQYWFYYPLNDGGNNHEGDWEHIDVLVSPRGKVGRPLSEQDIFDILDGRGLVDENTPEQLVIDKVEFYFHHKVMTFDYARPNVYLPREQWEQQVDSFQRTRIGIRKIWRRIRWVAYEDENETKVNTHPVAYIGADNKGIDQILSAPGARNQDSHGVFPMPGLYKTIGPAGSAEQVPIDFDHKKWFANESASRAGNQEDLGRGHTVLFDDPHLLDLVPDWERVLPLVRTDAEARRRWSWLVLPVLWGFPASPSPLAGLIPHADMGNVGPVGPAYNAGWNRSGTGRGYEDYNPNALSPLFPTEPQDGFSNSLGFFNVVPAMLNLPPLDLLWRVIALPVRATIKRQDPLFYPEQKVPPRFIGVSVGTSYTRFPDLLWTSVAHLSDKNDFFGSGVPEPLIEIALHLIPIDSTAGGDLPSQSTADPAWGVNGQISFFVGERFVSSTGFRHTRTSVMNQQPLATGGLYTFGADANWWDLTGTIRYNLATGGFKPFVYLGYGVNWYRLENMTNDGEPLGEPTGVWIYNWWPPTWQYGLGGELMIIQSFAPLPKGIDVGVRVEYGWLSSPTGVNLPGQLTIEALREIPKRWVRSTLNFGVTVSF